MANTKIATHEYKLHVARQVLESISEVSNTAYYVFMGEHLEAANTSNVEMEDTVGTTYRDAYRNMIQGKRVTRQDANVMIRYIPWESNKVFDMYDDSLALEDLDYYCVVNADAYFHTYKCLDNNLEANSTSEPNFAHISGANTQVYQTADGYRWKYMYSVTNTVKAKFGTSDFFPLVPNTTVSAAATEGVLDIIRVEGTGRGYDNYLLGTFAATDIRVNGNTVLYGLSSSNTVTVNGFYTGCLCYISSGTGAGSFASVINYFSNGAGNYIEINEPFEIAPLNGSQYQLYPEVLVSGSGRETVNVVARALVNSTNSNSIYRVEVLDRGAEYDYFTANALANDVVGVLANAELRAIYAPFGGHGFDAAAELGATRICFSVKFSNSESNTMLTANDFRQVGLIKDPYFANVNLKLEDVFGTFLDDEYMCKITPRRLESNATLSSTSTTLSCATADFSNNQVAEGEFLFLVSSDGIDGQLVEIESVTNTTSVELVSNGMFSCTETIIYSANITANGYVLTLESGANLFVTNVSGIFQDGDLIIGHTSGARATVNTVWRNGVDKEFNSFIQLYKYTGTLVSGSYVEDETVYQNSLTLASAALHSTVVDGADITLYTSNQVGEFHTANSIVGSTSGAITTQDNRYSPELVFGSGQVMYLENIDAVSRDPAQSETIKIICEY